uniref:Laminin, gamma 2 n=1 Tax=Cyprinus carpio TaxID=7962 RepID=A0A8C1ZXJ0_CYPCA
VTHLGIADQLGFYCMNCQGNTEGRHCENCKEGYYHQRAGDNCVPCNCNTAGSQGPVCNNEGRCTCKQAVYGDKCDRCHDGSPVTAKECLPCFCNGHSSVCSSAEGYSIHNITSTFENGPEGWRAATAQGVNPSQVQFRWSPTHKDIEVISKEVLPVYLFAPASYLGNQALSYGQTLSFALRLDRGVRRPSTSDVILEGAGLKVSASLGDLRTVVHCGKKITYTFKLDEQPGSKWKPQLSSTEFQTLLSNLTAIKIRATFGENGRGYLDDVSLVSAKLGPGTPAVWVEKCRCPAGYGGLFCERCATGYRRRFPGQGPQSPCDPCSCQGGTCDPETGGCYSADEIPNLQMCPKGYYVNRQQSNSCQKCPCPEGEACYVIPGTQEVMCARCTPGTTGSRCEICDDGFYGDPLGEYGPPKQCQPCQCYGHVDQNAVGNCDRRTGECRKCLSHSTGPKCENCDDGYYHSYPTEPCQACNCNRQGSVSNSCNDKGQCKCKEGYDGLKCDKSTCPSCFNPVKSKVYARQLQDMEDLFKGIGGDDAPVNDAQMVRAIRAAEVMVQSLQIRAIWVFRFDLQPNSFPSFPLCLFQEFPSGDALPGADTLSDLVQRAADLAKHQGEAVTVETIAANSLAESEKAIDLIRGVINRENNVKGELRDLKRQYEADVTKVLDMDRKAVQLTDTAGKESGVAQNTLKQLSDLEKKLPKPLAVVQDKLLARANDAEAVKNKSLEIFANNMDSLDKTLETLKGFDDQISGNKDLADAAIRKLPAINATIQKAIADNVKTQDILDAMSPQYRDAQDTIDTLKSTATKLQGMSDALPPSLEILETATKLKKDVDGLMKGASVTRDKLNEEKNQAKAQITQAENVRMSLENAITESRSRVEKELRPKLRELEKKEAQQRDTIAGMISDIDTILADIANLEEIRKSIPNGCYNIPPIERP